MKGCFRPLAGKGLYRTLFYGHSFEERFSSVSVPLRGKGYIERGMNTALRSAGLLGFRPLAGKGLYRTLGSRLRQHQNQCVSVPLRGKGYIELLCTLNLAQVVQRYVSVPLRGKGYIELKMGADRRG